MVFELPALPQHLDSGGRCQILPKLHLVWCATRLRPWTFALSPAYNITVPFHMSDIFQHSYICLPMTLSCMTAVLKAQIRAIVGLSGDLKRISNWVNQWDTTFNASKSMHMLFNFRQPKLGRRRYWLWVLPVEIPFTEWTRHMVWCWHRA